MALEVSLPLYRRVLSPIFDSMLPLRPIPLGPTKLCCTPLCLPDVLNSAAFDYTVCDFELALRVFTGTHGIKFLLLAPFAQVFSLLPVLLVQRGKTRSACTPLSDSVVECLLSLRLIARVPSTLYPTTLSPCWL
jgi:hypothetical protein